MGPRWPGQSNQPDRKGSPGCGGTLVDVKVASRGQMGSNSCALLGRPQGGLVGVFPPELAESPAEGSCSEALGNWEWLGQAPSQPAHSKASLTLFRPAVACVSPEHRLSAGQAQVPFLPPWGPLSLHPLHPPLSPVPPQPTPLHAHSARAVWLVCACWSHMIILE